MKSEEKQRQSINLTNKCCSTSQIGCLTGKLFKVTNIIEIKSTMINEDFIFLQRNDPSVIREHNLDIFLNTPEFFIISVFFHCEIFEKVYFAYFYFVFKLSTNISRYKGMNSASLLRSKKLTNISSELKKQKFNNSALNGCTNLVIQQQEIETLERFSKFSVTSPKIHYSSINFPIIFSFS